MITELNRAIKKLLTKVKFQKKSYQENYWNKKLEAKTKEVEVARETFQRTNIPEDYRLVKNRKNTLMREIKKSKKKYYLKRMSLGLGKWKT